MIVLPQYAARWNFPLDPDCPEVKDFSETLHNDPMTAYSGCGDEIQEDWDKKHRLTCKRCQEYGAANVEVI